MAFVSITRLHIRSWRYLPGFYFLALLTALQAKSAAGNLAVLLLNEGRNTFWTCTVWNDEAAMRAFMMAGSHRRAMPKLLEWCDEASVVHWVQDGTHNAQAPSWSEAHQRMQTEGRRLKVNHPSENHLAYIIPAPRVSGALRFK